MSEFLLHSVSLLDADATTQMVSMKDRFFFLFVLSEERDRHGSIDSRRQLEEEIQENACHLLA